jgi:hypothetical protein
LYDLEAAFKVWRSGRNQLMGFEPRVVLDGVYLQAQSLGYECRADNGKKVYRFML